MIGRRIGVVILSLINIAENVEEVDDMTIICVHLATKHAIGMGGWIVDRHL